MLLIVATGVIAIFPLVEEILRVLTAVGANDLD